MRTVAVILALLSAMSMLPVSAAADECASPGVGSACVPISAQRPVSPPNVPSLPDNAYWGKYYLWVGAGHCAPAATSNDCRGFPSAPNSGLPLPTGSTVGLGAFGMLYEESNGLAGLQRSFTTRVADRMVLV